LEPIWDNFLADHAIGDVGLIQSLEFFKLVKGGIADCYRGHVWKVCSGAINKKKRDKHNYSYYLEQAKNKKTAVNRQIEIDLRRSLSDHPFFSY
jgi:hypothetical protein